MIDIVVGAGFGDEGKGQTVSNLIESRRFDHGVKTNLIVRFNGGHQAGHTVEYNGLRHIFSNFGAGTLQGIPTYWSKYCTIHPKAIKAEYEILTRLDYDILRNKSNIKPVLYIDPLCPVTLPYDIFFQNDKGHGTVGVGFGQTIQRHEDHFKIFAADLLNEDILRIKFENIEKHYYKGNFNYFSEFYDECCWLINNLDIRIKRPNNLENSIFEGSQGILLDEEYGFFPHVTRSKTTAKNAFQIIKDYDIGEYVNVNYVSRSYSTRHGNGQFPTEDYSHLLNLKDDILETNVCNTHQGEFRKSILDINLLKYAINLAELDINDDFYTKNIIFTCTNHHKDDIIPILINNEVKYFSEEQLLNLEI